MSRIYFTAKTDEAEVRGSERAHMGILTKDFGTMVLNMSRGIGEGHHPLANVLDPSHTFFNYLSYDQYTNRNAIAETQYHVGTILGDHMGEAMVTIGGERHSLSNMAHGAMCVAGSEPMALMSKLHGYCEIHAWVAEQDRDWLAGVIEEGRAANIMRADQGWEYLTDFLRDVELIPGPVVTSYSVCDGFPNAYVAGWESDKEDSWYDDLNDDERWALAYTGLLKHPWLQLTPDTLRVNTFADLTLWDVIESPEWHGQRVDA